MPPRRFLFLLASARQGGNAETLARRAASALPDGLEQHWLRLTDMPLPAFVDIRHSGDGVYPIPDGDALRLLQATLAATDVVFVAPVYWYGLPASAKLYLDHWSGWMRVPGVDFRARMAGKTLWAISSYSDEDVSLAEPLFATLRLTADYMDMRWGGQVLGSGNRPGEVLNDTAAVAEAAALFQPSL